MFKKKLFFYYYCLFLLIRKKISKKKDSKKQKAKIPRDYLKLFFVGGNFGFRDRNLLFFAVYSISFEAREIERERENSNKITYEPEKFISLEIC